MNKIIRDAYKEVELIFGVTKAITVICDMPSFPEIFIEDTKEIFHRLMDCVLDPTLEYSVHAWIFGTILCSSRIYLLQYWRCACYHVHGTTLRRLSSLPYRTVPRDRSSLSSMEYTSYWNVILYAIFSYFTCMHLFLIFSLIFYIVLLENSIEVSNWERK